LFPGQSMSSIAVHAVYPSARHVPAKVRAFVEYLEEQFKKLPGFAVRASGEAPPRQRRLPDKQLLS